MQTRKTTKRAPRSNSNWRGRNQAAWRDLMTPEGVAKLLGKPIPPIDEIYARDIEKLLDQVTPRGRRAFRLQLVTLLRKVSTHRPDGKH